MHPIRIVDQYLFENESPDESRITGRYRPTEASLVIPTANGSQVVGTCMRQSWYRYMGLEITDPPSVSRIRRMQWGSLIEANERVYLRRSNLLYAENVSVSVPLNDGLVLNGVVDAVINRGDPILVEIKTGYGNNFFRSVLDPSMGRPSPAHILQGMLYLYMYIEAKQLVFLYYDRGTSNRREHWLSISNYRAVINNSIDYNYNIMSIIERYAVLHQHIIQKRLPRRDYLPSEEISSRRAVSGYNIRHKTLLQEHNTKGYVGDWQCRDCPFKSRCIEE